MGLTELLTGDICQRKHSSCLTQNKLTGTKAIHDPAHRTQWPSGDLRDHPHSPLDVLTMACLHLSSFHPLLNGLRSQVLLDPEHDLISCVQSSPKPA